MPILEMHPGHDGSQARERPWWCEIGSDACLVVAWFKHPVSASG